MAWRDCTASTWWFQACGLLLDMMWCWQRWGATPSTAVYRRKHGEKEARATTLGQAISYRFERDAKGWRVFAATELPEIEITTDHRRGPIKVDLNADHLAVAQTDASGNYVNAWRVPLVTLRQGPPSGGGVDRRRGGECDGVRAWSREAHRNREAGLPAEAGGAGGRVRC